MVKTFKNLLLQNLSADDLESWHVHWAFRPIIACSNDDLVMPLTNFMSRSFWPTFAERLLKRPYKCQATGILGFGGYSSINTISHSVSKERTHACR